MIRLIEVLVVPSGIVSLLVIAGVLSVAFARTRVLTIYLLAGAALVYAVFGSGLTTKWIMGALEQEIAPAQETLPPDTLGTIVVLAGYAQSSITRPLSGQVNGSSAFRVLEAARLAARTPRLKVIISGSDEVPFVMKRLLIQQGVADVRIEIDSASANTYESAVHLRDRLKTATFYLVTSAGHMPRATAVFRMQGLSAVPAPTDYLAPQVLAVSSLWPTARNLAVSDLAVHEHLAILWYRILGHL